MIKIIIFGVIGWMGKKIMDCLNNHVVNGYFTI